MAHRWALHLDFYVNGQSKHYRLRSESELPGIAEGTPRRRSSRVALPMQRGKTTVRLEIWSLEVLRQLPRFLSTASDAAHRMETRLT